MIQESNFKDVYLSDKFWKSSLFSEIYLKNGLQEEYSDILNLESEPFNNFVVNFQSLCNQMKDEEFSTWSETDTINNWIKPVMKALGWESQPNLTMESVSFQLDENGNKTYRTDILYVDDPKGKQIIKEENNPERRRLEAKNHVRIIVEAKYWDRLKQYKKGEKEMSSKVYNQKKKIDDVSLSPEEQILKYIEITYQDYGILTDGKTWKLFHARASNDSLQRCFEFDLGNLMEFYLINTNCEQRRIIFQKAIKYFYFFFSKNQLICERLYDECAVDKVLKFSQK